MDNKLLEKKRKEEEEEGENLQFFPNHPLNLIPELCKHFYNLGWCTGTGGGLSIRDGDDVYIAPSGVQKERLESKSIYVFDPSGKIKSSPAGGQHKPSACTPLFFNAYDLRNAGAVFHSHAPETALITLLYPGREFRISRLEMMKGIKGHGYNDTLVVPIVENTPHEAELRDVMREAMIEYPKATAVLVRRHGIYIWGDTWEQAKSQAECYHYLFNFVIESKKIGIDLAPLYPKPRCILLDIEGTTTSISFVKETLFPIARKKIRDYVLENQKDPSIQEEYLSIKATMEKEGKSCDNISDAILQLEQWIDEDRKHPSLKSIQGSLWKESYLDGSIKGHLYEDVAPALAKWKEDGIDLAIYSSGSVPAQKLLFGHSVNGDLTPLFRDYFDTSVGHKREADSYRKISQHLGINSNEILFLSDIREELEAAEMAGFQVAQLCRDGIPKYLYNYRFQILKDFFELSI